MKIKTKRKNYVFSNDFAKEIENRAISLKYSETQAVEYFLKLGFEVYDSRKSDEKVISAIDKIKKEQKFIKKLLIQLFVNKKFPINRSEKDDEAYQEFLINIFKDNYID